ncbi:MAG: response regulator [Anaerolineae bacterium]|nr:response regulator [Anaerolineae bacterium]
MYHTIEMLVVDDNPGDVRLCQEFFRANKFSNQVNYVPNPEHMLRYLQRDTPYQQVPSPDVILLSIRPFLMDGLQYLSDLKQQVLSRNILLLGLTAAEGEEAALKDEASVFAGYMVKPLDLTQLRLMLAKIEYLGLIIVKQPRPEQRSALAQI